MMKNNPKICIVSDGTDTITQSRELAMRLASADNITKIYRDELFEMQDFPDLAIGVGFNVTETLVKLKQESSGKTKIAIILDPLAHYEKFDFIILPSYEPYKVQGNVLRTTGLINFVNEGFLKAQKDEFLNHEKYKLLRNKNLKPPFLTVVIGGRHTGGNITEDDAKMIAEKVNQLVTESGGTALITTSSRTEIMVAQTLRRNLEVPYFLYDYKVREIDNPYGVFLSLADEMIVTGESVRMLSECCSAGKPVRIYRPKEFGFQYKALIDELVKGGYAAEFDYKAVYSKLDEAGKIAQLINNYL